MRLVVYFTLIALAFVGGTLLERERVRVLMELQNDFR